MQIGREAKFFRFQAFGLRVEQLFMAAPLSMPAEFIGGQRYYAFSRFLKNHFGAKVYRVTIDAGFTCPNVDGTVTTGGCVYCDNRSFSPNRRLPRTSWVSRCWKRPAWRGRRAKSTSGP